MTNAFSDLSKEYEKNVLKTATPQRLKGELHSIEEAIACNQMSGMRGEQVLRELQAKKAAILRILPEKNIRHSIQ